MRTNHRFAQTTKRNVRTCAVIALSVLFPVMVMSSANAAQTPVGLGTADSFSVLAGQTITNTGVSTINGDVGLSPGGAVTGFAPCPAANCVTLSGSLHISDNVALKAKDDLKTAYDDAAGRTPATTVATELGGTTETAGVYNSASGTFGITAGSGPLILDGQADPTSVFIFQMQTTLTASSASVVSLINGANACNVFWQVGSSATIGTNSSFKGNILALTSIAVQTGATVGGRTLARNGEVTLDTNTLGGCASAAPSPGNVEVANTHQYKGSAPVRTNGKWVYTLQNSSGTFFLCTHPNPSDPTKCTTNLNGNNAKLSYLGLPPGTYTLCEKPFASWKTRFSNLPPGSTVTGRCVTFTLNPGDNFTSANHSAIKVNNFCKTPA
jgi:hypothetical protein